MDWILRLSRVVVVDESAVRGDLAASGEPADQGLVGSHLAVELVHVLRVDDVRLNPLLVLLVPTGRRRTEKRATPSPLPTAL